MLFSDKPKSAESLPQRLYKMSRQINRPALILSIIGFTLLGAIVVLSYGTIFTLSQTSVQRELIKTQQAALHETQVQLSLLREQNVTLASLLLDETTELKEETSTLFEQFVDEQTRRQDAETARDRASVASAVKEWRPLIASVICRFERGTQRGSGTLIQDGGELYIMTNSHVVINNNNVPNECTIQFPGRTSQTVAVTADTIIADKSKIDVATIHIENPNNSITELANKQLSKKSPGFSVCEDNPVLGEQIIILGYPAIGGAEDITATEGIISSFDGKYYVTSAKVERGNSGGAAVNLRYGCYLGIPTFVQSGQIESLARILKASEFFIN